MKIPVFVLVLLSFGVNAQTSRESKYDPVLLREQIRENLDLLSHYNEDTEEIDFDAAKNQLTKNLMAYLRQDTLSEKQLYGKEASRNFFVSASVDGKIRLYTYSFHSGGTRGEVDLPIIQWKKSDDSWGAYELPYEMHFYSIDRLESERTLYLLSGMEKGSSRLFVAMSLVIRIKNDYLILDYPAFFNESSSLVFFDDISSGDGDCIACMEFDPKTQSISVEKLGNEDEVGIWEKDAASIVQKLDKGAKACSFRFDGEKFVKK